MIKKWSIVTVSIFIIFATSCKSEFPQYIEFDDVASGKKIEWNDNMLYKSDGNNTEIAINKIESNTYSFNFKKNILSSKEYLGKGFLKINESFPKKGEGTIELTFSEFSSFGSGKITYSYSGAGKNNLFTTVLSSTYQIIQTGEQEVLYRN